VALDAAAVDGQPAATRRSHAHVARGDLDVLEPEPVDVEREDAGREPERC
jgi:hypothetical protein